jgi:pimeloyl-ACP methyl ester carboxylesterase
MERSVLTVAGIRSPILRAGNPSSTEAAVFIHGNPGSSGDWAGLVEGVGSFGRALAMDMPGFGKADKPAAFEYSIGGYARHLGKMLAAEHVERAHLVLHDFGGAWGLAWAAENVARVGSVTLINVGILPGYRWHYMARIWRTPVLGELSMATTTRAILKLSLKHGNPRGLPDAYIDEMYENFDAGTRRAVLRLYRNTGDMGVAATGLAAVLAPCSLPALVIWGAQDPYVPVKFADLQRQFFAVERVVRLEDSGHWPMIDNPDAVQQAVIPFLRERLRGLPEGRAARS